MRINRLLFFGINAKIRLILLILIAVHLSSSAQKESFSIKKTSFSSDKFDEFAPVFYKGGLVFCTNRNSGMADYSTSQNQGLLKIFYADTTAGGKWHNPRLLSKELKTKLNDGPVTFNGTSDTIYYSRNQITDERIKKILPTRNKLGIFYAVYDGKKWTKIREMRFNSEWYNLTTPYLSPDGTKIYFASDKPDGYGGSDIYYSQLKNGYWEDPVNLGPTVNTKGNESYPFMNEDGELFFSSDGHQSLGGKDIFVTKVHGAGWYQPIRLEEPINSKFDDFGIVMTADKNEGYFSSNRGKTIDIFQFRSDLLQVWFSEIQKKNQYCISISDTGSIQVDTMKLNYEWDFGDNTKVIGRSVQHCYPGPGRYKINLDLSDRKRGTPFLRKLSYDIEIVDFEQPFITSPDYAVIGDTVEFSGMKSFCPGNRISGYFWDFGDGIRGEGEKTGHAYNVAGEYEIRLGVRLRSIITGNAGKKAVTKKILIFATEQEKTAYLSGLPVARKVHTDIEKYPNVIIHSRYSAENDYKKEAIFQVEILRTSERTPLNSTFFKNVPAKYSVKEVYDAEAGIYSYIVDQHVSLMATYPAYNELIAGGYNNACVRIFVLTDPAEKELYVFERTYGLLTDSYFDASNRLVTNAYLMLDQVVLMMNKYPGIILEIGVHTDNQGLPASLQSLSLLRAQMIMNYLIDRGVNSNRMIAKGYGSTRPLTSNTTYLDKRLNRRIDFTILLNQ